MRSRRILAIVVVAAALCYSTRDMWLGWAGRFLIQTDPLEHADVIVVLAGDGSGLRLDQAVKLMRDGYAPLVLADGSADFYGARECDLALDYAKRAGAGDAVESLCMQAHSTLEESQIVDTELRSRQVRSAIVVTSDYHTRRAKMIFSQLENSPIRYRFDASPTQGFDPDNWWRSREGRKIAGVEWLKTLHSWLERLD